MTPQDIRAAVIEELENIAPEADASAVPGDLDLCEELDIDSMDVLNFVTALHKRLKVDITDCHHPKLQPSTAPLPTCKKNSLRERANDFPFFVPSLIDACQRAA
jgi:acyl carrier protein